jgi:hypothetical protein
LAARSVLVRISRVARRVVACLPSFAMAVVVRRFDFERPGDQDRATEMRAAAEVAGSLWSLSST